MALIEVKVPDIGDFAEVAVIELLVKVGDTVKAEQSLVTVEATRLRWRFHPATPASSRNSRSPWATRSAKAACCWCWTAPDSAAAAPGPSLRACSSGPGCSASTGPGRCGPAAASSVVVVVPDIGDFDEVAVIELFVKAGDTVKKAEQSLITVESDKASMEIPSSHAGVVEELLVTSSATRSPRARRWCV